jgi:hypothetical protein
MKKQKSLDNRISALIKVKMHMIEMHQAKIERIDRKISTLTLESILMYSFNKERKV